MPAKQVSDPRSTFPALDCGSVGCDLSEYYEVTVRCATGKRYGLTVCRRHFSDWRRLTVTTKDFAADPICVERLVRIGKAA